LCFGSKSSLKEGKGGKSAIKHKKVLLSRKGAKYRGQNIGCKMAQKKRRGAKSDN